MRDIFQNSSWRERSIGLLFVLIVVCALFISNSSMFSFSLFSEVTGSVTNGAVPVAGAKITRTYEWAWKNKKATDETVTDAQGKFLLPVITGTSILASILPHEPFIRQDIFIEYEGKKYRAWAHDKRSYDLGGELSNNKNTSIKLLCNTETPEHHMVLGADGKPASDSPFGICSIAGE